MNHPGARRNRRYKPVGTITTYRGTPLQWRELNDSNFGQKSVFMARFSHREDALFAMETFGGEKVIILDGEFVVI